MRGNVKVDYNGDPVTVHFNEFGSMFTLESTQGYREGEIEAYCSARQMSTPLSNQAWLLREFLTLLVGAQIVEPVMDGPNMVVEESEESEVGEAVLVNVIHPMFNDQGFSNFGDFCRSRLGQQSQYGSRYIDGRLEGYPALGDGLRFSNGLGYNGEVVAADARDYHSIRIHRDDMDEFERRYKAYCEERLR